MSVDSKQLFIEIVSFMGMRDYDITPFMFLLENKMKNDRHIQLGELDKIEEISNESIIEFLNEYRVNNFFLDPSYFIQGRLAFSVPFVHSYNGITTLVIISNEEPGSLTSKDKIKDFMVQYATPLVINLTNGLSSDLWCNRNRITGIFVLSEGVSSYSKTFLDELEIIEIITTSEIMSRCYDSCLQSNISTISSEEKKLLLSEVGLTTSTIPSVTKKNDILCRILGLKQGNLMISHRRKIASEETVTDALFIRDIK